MRRRGPAPAALLLLRALTVRAGEESAECFVTLRRRLSSEHERVVHANGTVEGFCIPREDFICSSDWMWVERGCRGEFECNGRNVTCPPRGWVTLRNARTYCPCAEGLGPARSTAPSVVPTEAPRRPPSARAAAPRRGGSLSVPGDSLWIVATHANEGPEQLRWMTRVLDEEPSVRIVLYACGFRPLPERLASHPRCTVVSKSGVVGGTDLAKLGVFYTYFDFVVRHYDKLPEWVLFLHGHDTSFEHRRMGSADVVRAVRRLITHAPAGNATDFVNVGESVWDTWLSPRTKLLGPCHFPGFRMHAMVDYVRWHWRAVRLARASRHATTGLVPPCPIPTSLYQSRLHWFSLVWVSLV